MTEQKSYPIGTFCWVVLGTTDIVAAKAFYGDLLNWKYQDDEMPQGRDYSTIPLGKTTLSITRQMRTGLLRGTAKALVHPAVPRMTPRDRAGTNG